MRTCNICNLLKPLQDFTIRKSGKQSDKPLAFCKACGAEKMRLARKTDPALFSDRRKALVEQKRKKLAEYLRMHPCVDCGNADLRVLEFDHVDGEKINGVAFMIKTGSSWESVLKEIDKCEVRCKNCHQIKTFERIGGSWHDKI